VILECHREDIVFFGATRAARPFSVHCRGLSWGRPQRSFWSKCMMRKSLLAVLVSGLMVTGVQAAANQVNGYLLGNIGQAEADKPGFIKGLDAESAAFADDF